MRIHRENCPLIPRIGDRMRGSCLPSSRNYPSSSLPSFLPSPSFSLPSQFFHSTATSRGENDELDIYMYVYKTSKLYIYICVYTGLAVIDDNSLLHPWKRRRKVSGRRFSLNCLRFLFSGERRGRWSLDSTLATTDARANHENEAGRESLIVDREEREPFAIFNRGR